MTCHVQDRRGRCARRGRALFAVLGPSASQRDHPESAWVLNNNNTPSISRHKDQHTIRLLNQTPGMDQPLLSQKGHTG